MKIRTKLLITFLTITVVPIFLIYIAIMGLSSYQNRVFRETYDVGQVDLSSGASIRVFSHLTESIQREIEEDIGKNPEMFTDQSYLNDLNARMTAKHSFLMVTENGNLIYSGNDEAASSLEREISDYAEINDSASWGNYLDSMEKQQQRSPSSEVLTARLPFSLQVSLDSLLLWDRSQ